MATTESEKQSELARQAGVTDLSPSLFKDDFKVKIGQMLLDIAP
jgi:hypothetical protein